MPKLSQILVSVFLILPSFASVLGLYGLASNPLPVWFLIATLSSLFLILFSKAKRKFHIVDQLFLSIVTIDFIFFFCGILLGGEPKIRALGLYREVGIYIPYLFARGVYIFTGKKFFYPVLSLVLGIYCLNAFIGIFQQFGILTFEAVARQAYKDIIPNIASYSGTEFLNRDGGNSSASRSYGWLGSPLEFAQIMATSASVSWALFLSAKKISLRVLFFFLFLILTVGMASALTRNYYLSLFLSTLTVTLYNFSLNKNFAKYIPLSTNKKYVIPFATITLGILLSITPFILSNSSLNSNNNTFANTLEKMFSNTLSKSDNSTNDHLRDILLFPEQLSKVPLGGGLGSYGVVSSRFGDSSEHFEGVWYGQILQRGILIQSLLFYILFSIVFLIVQRARQLFKDSLYRKTDSGLYRFIILTTIAIFVNTFVSGFFLPDLYIISNGCLVFAIIAFSSSVVFTSK